MHAMMAHANVDYHMDFISLLSLSSIGVVEPEVSMAKKRQQTVSPAGGVQAPNPSSNGGLLDSPQCFPHFKNGDSLHSLNMNGLERGVKRVRETVAPDLCLGQEQSATKVLAMYYSISYTS